MNNDEFTVSWERLGRSGQGIGAVTIERTKSRGIIAGNINLNWKGRCSDEDLKEKAAF